MASGQVQGTIKEAFRLEEEDSLDSVLYVSSFVPYAEMITTHLSLRLLKNSQALGCFSVATSSTGTPSETEFIG